MQNDLCLRRLSGSLSFAQRFIYWVTYLHLDNIDFVLDSKKVVEYFSTNNNDITKFVCIMNACKLVFSI